MTPPLKPIGAMCYGRPTPIPEFVPLYVDDRFPGMDKRWAVRTIVAGRLARDTARGKGHKAAKRAYAKARLSRTSTPQPPAPCPSK